MYIVGSSSQDCAVVVSLFQKKQSNTFHCTGKKKKEEEECPNHIELALQGKAQQFNIIWYTKWKQKAYLLHFTISEPNPQWCTLSTAWLKCVYLTEVVRNSVMEQLL